MLPESPQGKMPMFEDIPKKPHAEPTRTPYTRAVLATPGADPAQDILPMTIPGSQESAAQEVNVVSPEGRPTHSDAKAGPGRVWMEMSIVALVIVAVAAAIGAFFNIWAGLVALAIGLLALVLNPVMGATVLRAKDRAEVIDKFHS